MLKTLELDQITEATPQQMIALINHYIKHPPDGSIVMEIEPETAELILSAYNKSNRKFKPHKIRQLVYEIARGQWLITGDTIKFSTKGLLLDGQNRLQACVEADRPISSHVVFGIKPLAFDRMDTGAQRTGPDMLQLIGVTEPNSVAHCIAWMHRLKSGLDSRSQSASGVGTRALTPHQIVDEYKKKYKDMQEHYEWGRRLKKAANVAMSRGMLLHYAFTKDQGPKKADAFMTALIDGFTLDEVPQAARLRTHLAHLSATTQTALPAIVYYACAIKAFNCWIDSKAATKSRISWERGEAFPHLRNLIK